MISGFLIYLKVGSDIDMKTIKCSVCGVLFESDGLKSCPAHSFGDEFSAAELEAWKDDRDYNI